MNKENLLIELGKAIQVDGRVNVVIYCRVVELIDTYISTNYAKPIVGGLLQRKCTCERCTGIKCESYYKYDNDGNDR